MGEMSWPGNKPWVGTGQRAGASDKVQSYQIIPCSLQEVSVKAPFLCNYLLLRVRFRYISKMPLLLTLHKASCKEYLGVCLCVSPLPVSQLISHKNMIGNCFDFFYPTHCVIKDLSAQDPLFLFLKLHFLFHPICNMFFRPCWSSENIYTHGYAVRILRSIALVPLYYCVSVATISDMLSIIHGGPKCSA